ETEAQVDYTIITDQLEAWLKKPLDLNRATKADLQQLPGLNDLQIVAILEHIAAYGDLTSIYELQAVRGLTPNVIREFIPFVTVNQVREKDMDADRKHPRGPGFQEIWQGLTVEYLQRVSWILEEQRGYTPADTIFRDQKDEDGNVIGEDTLFNSRYIGSAQRIYSRMRIQYGNHLSLAMVGEKDPGEAFRWDPNRQQYGFDFLSGHISIGNYGRLKRLVIGDYTMQFGQGLILSPGLGFGKGATVIKSTKMPARGLRPYSSVNENQVQRGVAATYAIGSIYLTGFYSRNRRDANILEVDTLTQETLFSAGIQTSGLHRTASELRNRRSITEELIGGRIEYRTRTLTIGTSHYIQRFGNDIVPPQNDFNLFAFAGDRNSLHGIDFDWVYNNVNFFGEVARSRSGGVGATLGLMSSIAPTVDVSLVARNFDRDFHSDKGYVFAERPTALQNEKGVYLGLRIAPNPRWTLSSYFDQYYFPFNRFQASFPSRGWEFFTQLDYKPKRGTLLYLRFRSDNRQTNADEEPEGPALERLVNARRDQFRIQFQTKAGRGRDLQFRTRLEFSWYQQEDRRERGMLLYQDLIWKPSFSFRVTGRYAIFDVSNFDARIFAYENDVLGFFSIPPYAGVGSRYYLILNWKAGRRVEFWARLAQSRFLDTQTIGSGLEQINGSTRSELKLQMRVKL
ncbi:MAG: helix-hairpin-helix domain-containing protein, partial [Bacteroidota bacterium]